VEAAMSEPSQVRVISTNGKLAEVGPLKPPVQAPSDLNGDLPKLPDPPTSWTLLSSLVKTKTILVVLLGTTLAAVLVALGDRAEGTPSVVMVSTGTSLFATIVYAILHVALVAPEQFRQLQLAAYTYTSTFDNRTGETHRLTREMSESLKLLRSEIKDLEFKPFVYPGSRLPDPLLNKDISSRLELSDKYTFVGLTGTFTVGRLKAMARESRIREVTIVLADPSNPTAVSKRIASEAGRPDTLGDTTDMIFQAVVGAYDVRRRFNRLTLSFVDPPPLDRYEIFDDCIFLSLFGDALSTGYRFPRTYRYDNTSPFYVSYWASTQHTIQNCSKSVTIVPNTSEDDLFQQLQAVDLSFAPNDLERCRSDFHQYFTGFYRTSQSKKDGDHV
jgi:hypothetical protein